MTVFRYFFKVMKEYKFTILLYTVILVFFGAFNLQTNDDQLNFTALKPDVLFINHDSDNKTVDNLYRYIEKNANIKNVETVAIDDALFYRDVNYIITIPEHYEKDFLEGKFPTIEVKSTQDANAVYMEMLLERYLKVANIYLEESSNLEEWLVKVNEVLDSESHIEIASKIDTDGLGKLSFYYNFANYSILAGCVFVVSTVLNSFRNEKINKRITISSMNYKKYNRQLFLGGVLFGVILWLLYVLISAILIKDGLFSSYGVLYLINSFLFTLCAVSLSFLIGNLFTNKEAINGIVNVIALGSSFLCGAFVPIEYLPESVLQIARILPSYWFIQSNELIKTIEVFNLENLKEFLSNSLIIVAFTILWMVLTNMVTKKKRKIN